MLKFLAPCFAFAALSVPAHAADRVTMNVRNLKTGELETKISFPLWVAKLGISMSKIVHVHDESVDLNKLIAEVEKQKQSGPFLTIEDRQENEKVSFELE